MAAPIRPGPMLPRTPGVVVVPTALAQALSGGAPMVVLRAPPGWGKTTTMASWLRRSAAQGEAVAWITVPAGSTRGQFWSLLRHGLGLPGASEGGQAVPPDGAALDGLVVGPGGSVHLVVDDFHHVTDTTVDRELVEILRVAGTLRLTVLSRVARPVEALAETDLDGVSLRARDLALGGPAVAELARGLHSPLDPESAETLARDLGGWPVLVRMALRHGLLDRRGDPQSILPYLEALHEEKEPRRLLDMVMRASLTETLDPGIAQALFESWTSPHAVIEALADAGLIGPSGGVPDTVRLAAAGLFADLHPAAARAAHQAAAHLRERDGDLASALHHASRAGDAGHVEALLTDHWSELSARPVLVRAALDILPPEVAESRAELALLRESSRARDPSWQGLELGLPRAQALRLPQLLTQYAVHRLARVDPIGAERAAQTAVQVAERAALPQERRHGLVHRALALAMLGKRREAGRALQAAAEIGTIATIAPREPALRALAGCVLDLDGGVDVRWPTDELDDLLDPADSDEAELLVLADLLRIATREGRSGPDLVAMLEAQWEAMADRAEPSLAATVVYAVWADVLVLNGDLEHGLELVAHPPASVAGVDPVLARLAFYAGDFDRALHHAADCEHWIASHPRRALDLLLVRCCAQLRTGQDSAAATSLHLAAAVGEMHDLIRPFRAVPSADLLLIAESSSRLTAYLRRCGVASGEDLFPPPLERVPLSAQEIKVLEALATGQTLSRIAQRLYVSSNTVKSHLRAIYSKLGVHTREAAVLRARTSGLLAADQGRDPDGGSASTPEPM
ncbi:LuxR C-terminal-related transcriptional regulator [Ruania suaedae]|uniref:LuxR C-terminal-related transcriptional regulator n=1 Tax=Ruania suaedae TaxID=2897774 RepID=UPI001E5FCF1E|nr:LuxR C-terminal-related transcriptional regulator [Ruania suaedae]UFU02414.1 LuxR C-terminal-related transcriptional regulator [Ruania suaedae]